MALIATGLVAVASGHVTFAAFSITTVNPADSYAAGTMTLSDNDAGDRDVGRRRISSPPRPPSSGASG